MSTLQAVNVQVGCFWQACTMPGHKAQHCLQVAEISVACISYTIKPYLCMSNCMYVFNVDVKFSDIGIASCFQPNICLLGVTVREWALVHN